MTPNNKEIGLWVREKLSQHGEWLIDRFIEALERNKHVDTGALADSFDYQTGSEQGAQTLAVSFLTYGRLIRRLTAGMSGREQQRIRESWKKPNGI